MRTTCASHVGLRGARLVGVGAHLLDLAFLHELVGAHLREVGARGVELGADLVGIEPRDDLVGFHLGIVVGEDLDDLAGQLRADDHGGGRVDGAGGVHGGDDLAAVGLGQPIAAFGRRAAPFRERNRTRPPCATAISSEMVMQRGACVAAIQPRLCREM